MREFKAFTQELPSFMLKAAEQLHNCSYDDDGE